MNPVYLVVDTKEKIFKRKPIRNQTGTKWEGHEPIILPRGSIQRLTGKQLTWYDEPYALRTLPII